MISTYNKIFFFDNVYNFLKYSNHRIQIDYKRWSVKLSLCFIQNFTADVFTIYYYTKSQSDAKSFFKKVLM